MRPSMPLLEAIPCLGLVLSVGSTDVWFMHDVQQVVGREGTIEATYQVKTRTQTPVSDLIASSGVAGGQHQLPISRRGAAGDRPEGHHQGRLCAYTHRPQLCKWRKA